MKVLFTHSYFLKFDPKQLRVAMPYPPLGTLYAAAFLRERGYDVKLADAMFCDSPSQILSIIDAYQPDVVVSYDDGFNYLTKMCLTNMREACFKIIEHAKIKGCKVIVSSSDAADHCEKYLAKGANAIAIGESEQTVFELCENFKSTSDFTNVVGIAYLKDSNVVKTAKRTVITDLDVLPEPAWDILDIKPYKEMWLTNHGYFSLNFVTTRGCPYKCNWCAKPIYGNRYNSHSPENIVLQIKKWQKVFGFSHVWFADDIFGLKPNWLKQFAEAIKKENVKIKYKIQSRADLLVEKETVKYLSESGCDTVWMGAESGSQKILDAMDKGIKVDEIRKAHELLRQNKIKTALFLQFGYLDEQMEDIKKTVDLVKELLPNDLGISVSYPLPGTKFYEQVKEQLQDKANWTDSNDLHLMFKNTYSPDFYRQLHRYVHHVYRGSIAMHNFQNAGVISLKSRAKYLYHKLLAEKVKKKINRLEPHASGIL